MTQNRSKVTKQKQWHKTEAITQNRSKASKSFGALLWNRSNDIIQNLHIQEEAIIHNHARKYKKCIAKVSVSRYFLPRVSVLSIEILYFQSICIEYQDTFFAYQVIPCWLFHRNFPPKLHFQNLRRLQDNIYFDFPYTATSASSLSSYSLL